VLAGRASHIAAPIVAPTLVSPWGLNCTTTPRTSPCGRVQWRAPPFFAENPCPAEQRVIFDHFFVVEPAESLGLTQPTISHHLKILVHAGILSRDKRGVWAYYALIPGVLDTVSSALRPSAAE